MAITLGYIDIVLAFIILYLMHRWWLDRKAPIRNWPVLGMVPGLLHNARRIHEFVTDKLRQSRWTYNVKGPWFAGMDFVITSDPMNIHHICSRNFDNYPKGREFKEIFDVLGEGIFNADGEMWRIQRKVLHSLFKNKKYESALVRTFNRKVENGLFPVLDHASELKITLDLQDVFERFTFDNICKLVLGSNPGSLSVGFPPNEYEKAFTKMEEAAFYRQIQPESCWKLQKWLQVGEEKKFQIAGETFYKFLNDCISVKKERLSWRRKADEEEEEEEFDLLAALLEEEEAIDEFKNSGFTMTDELFRDISFNLIAAGRDTISSGLTWFFWLVATHPSVE
ncbi:alkane hydroxylase MAH1-like [Mangifera indica]|uniref:alkane hydroxylase MAH1-like n=1 Tax=Mangifera indica TaxID=29780 RepID=UPI001CF9D5DE|nr:alkane hydroxylase MAH1-like [Mangifera indica]